MAVRPACSLVLSVLIAFLPKCPVCWAAGLGALGIIDATALSHLSWLFPGLVALLGVQLLLLLRQASQTHYGPFALALSGAAIFLAGRHYAPAARGILATGVLLVAAGSLWHSIASRNARPGGAGLEANRFT